MFRRILKPVTSLSAVAAVVCAYNLLAVPLLRLPEITLNIAPFSLLGPVLGLLLIYRTNRPAFALRSLLFSLEGACPPQRAIRQ